MDKEKALDKIRKLLALAGSDNANEAATALRQAQKMMRMYGIDDDAVELSAVKSEGVTSGRASVPDWLWALAVVVGESFSCRAWIESGWGQASIHFMGVGANPKIATYAFTILRRKLTADRSIFYRKTRGKRVNRTRRADQFAFAWVNQVSLEVNRFAGSIPGIVDRALALMEQQNDMTTTSIKDRGKMEVEAVLAGKAVGAGVTLQQGVGGYQQGLIEGW